MDSRTGEIRPMTREDWLKLPDDEKCFWSGVEPTKKQLLRMKIGRNDPCPCGSKVKFKRCCLGKTNSIWRD